MTRRRVLADRGYVLVNALLIVAALSVLAVQSLDRATDRRAVVTAARTGAEATLMADAGVTFAIALLADDLSGDPVDHAGEAWSLSGQSILVGGGSVAVSIRDAQGAFNVNLLGTRNQGSARLVLDRLVAETGADPALSGALAAHYPRPPGGGLAGPADPVQSDWFRAGDLTHAMDLHAFGPVDGAEDAFMLIDAFPRAHAVNVNSADATVLGALAGVPAETLTPLLARRAAQPFADLAEFRSALAAVAGDAIASTIPSDLLTVSSAWFDVETRTLIDGMSFMQVTRLYRDEKTGEIMRYYAQRRAP